MKPASERAKKEGYKLQYGSQKVMTPICPLCKKFLIGNNSHASRYRCTDCEVEWVPKSYSNPSVFIAISEGEKGVKVR